MLRAALLVTFLALVCASSAAAAPWPGAAGVPKHMERTYKQAGERFGVSPRLLAAIGLSESRHGRARRRVRRGLRLMARLAPAG